MILPVDLGELSILLAVTAMILLATSILLSSRKRRINTIISRKRLRRAAIGFSILFLVIVGLRIYNIVSAATIS